MTTEKNFARKKNTSKITKSHPGIENGEKQRHRQRKKLIRNKKDI